MTVMLDTASEVHSAGRARARALLYIAIRALDGHTEVNALARCMLRRAELHLTARRVPRRHSVTSELWLRLDGDGLHCANCKFTPLPYGIGDTGVLCDHCKGAGR